MLKQIQYGIDIYIPSDVLIFVKLVLLFSDKMFSNLLEGGVETLCLSASVEEKNLISQKGLNPEEKSDSKNVKDI